MNTVAATANYPLRPIRVIIAQDAGSSVDTNIRTIAPLLGQSLGQQLVIDNRPGAGGAVGMAIGAAASKDGYSIVGVGTLNDTSWVKPAVEIYCDAAQPWVSLGGGMTRFPGMIPRG